MGKENQTNPFYQPETRRMFLRDFGRVALGFSVGSSLLAGGCLQKDRVQKQFEQTAITLVPKTNVVEYRKYQGLKVAINNDGLPIEYTLPDGRIIPFDLNQILEVQRLAQETQEPQLISVIELPFQPKQATKERPNLYKGQKDHHPLAEPPEDTLSTEELKERGVAIIQDGDIELSVRAGAFEKGGLLRAFNRTGEKLTIVLVNCSILYPEFVKDDKFDSVRNLIKSHPNDVSKIRKERMEYLYDDFTLRVQELLSKSIREGRSTKLDESLIIEAKADIFAYKNFVTDLQVLIEYYYANPFIADNSRGLYAPNKHILPYFEKIFRNPNVAIIAVGDAKLNTDMAYFYFLHDGAFSFKYDTGEQRVRKCNYCPMAYGVTVFQSFPDPDAFQIDPDASPDNPKSYLYFGQTPGLVLRHELAHGDLTTGNPGNPNFSEYDADKRAMQTIREAWQKWKDSGFTDNSGYHFVFKVRNEGFILT